MRDHHDVERKKRTGECNIADIGVSGDEYLGHWIILLDKGYKGALEFVRTISSKKKPDSGTMSLSDETVNRLVSSDRVIVENYFGRTGTLWTLMSSK